MKLVVFAAVVTIDDENDYDSDDDGGKQGNESDDTTSEQIISKSENISLSTEYIEYLFFLFPNATIAFSLPFTIHIL